MKEVWKPIQDFIGYEVSNLGRVRSYNRRWRLMKEPHYLHAITIKGGYQVVRLNSGAVKNKGYLVHRLVIEAFISKIPEGKEVNHKDANTRNNKLSNLEICDHKYNVQYGASTKSAITRSKSCKGIFRDGTEKIFPSALEAARYVKTSRGMVYAIIRGRKKSVHGWRFTYVVH